MSADKSLFLSRRLAVRAQLVAVALLSLAIASPACALPFNDDMVAVQPRTGSVMRPKAPGAVSVGSLAFRVDNRQAAEALTNPMKGDTASTDRGRRLFAVNCSPCHGDMEQPTWTPGVAGTFFGNVPDIRGVDPARQKDYRQQSDGFYYGVIHFGSLSTVMPPYGWKLSPTEHWDIINFIRSVQSK